MTLNWPARIGLAAAATTGITAVMIAHAVRKELRREAVMDLAETDLEAEREAWRLMPSDPPPMVFKPREELNPFVHDPRFDPCGGGPIHPEVTP